MEHLINLNFAPGGLPATVHVSQYDDTIRQLRFQLWFGRSKVEVPSGASVRVDIKKPDGHIVLVNGTVNSSDRSIVTVPTTKQMTAVPGGSRGTLVVSSTGDKRISSAIFILQVHRDPVEDGDASDSDLSMLQDAIDQTAANATAAQAAAKAAQQAASSFTTDTTLSVSGKAADAKKTGDELTAIKADLSAVSDGSFSTEEKRSMLFYILRHALYDSDLTSIINTLESAMQGADTPYTILQRCALDGTQYVDTGLSFELDECTVETTIIRTVDDTKARCILASNNTIYPQLRKTSANGRHVMIKNRGAAMDVGTFDWTTGEPYTLKYDIATNKVTVNGTDIISSVSDGETPSSANYTLFASGANVSASDNRFIGYFYGLKVSKNGQVIHEYKPAKRNLDNRIGILDTVTMTFLLSATNYDILEG